MSGHTDSPPSEHEQLREMVRVMRTWPRTDVCEVALEILDDELLPDNVARIAASRLLQKALYEEKEAEPKGGLRSG